VTPPPAAAAASPRTRTRPARPARPPLPRRVSGPARGRAASAPRPVARQSGSHPVAAVLGALAALPDHRLFNRLVASKAWVGVIAFALIGIVTLQLVMLRLNTGIGHALQREESLQRQNAALGVANSELASGERVESQATKLGMELTAAGSLRFLHAGGRSALLHAAGALQAPVQPPEPAASSTAASHPEAQGSETHERESQASTAEGQAASAGASTSGEAAKTETPSTASHEAAPASGGEAAAAATGGEAAAQGSGAEAQAGGAASG
jgi:hypothetical protein